MEKDLTEKLFEELKKQGIYEQEDTIEDEDENDERTIMMMMMMRRTIMMIQNLPIIMKISVKWFVKYYIHKHKFIFSI